MADEKNDTPKEAHAYTPGLKVKRYATVDKTRRLPILGEVFVKVGDTVDYETIIAKTELSGDPEIIKASMLLGIEPEDLSSYLQITVGDHIEKGEILASYTALFGLIKKRVESPKTGTIESISEVTGQIILRCSPIPVEVDAYIPGKVVRILPKEGAVIETNAAFIQGIFGIGGEDHGRIRIAVESPDNILTVDAINPEDKGAILVGGSLVTLDAMKKCVEVGVSCIVVGGCQHKDLTAFTKEEIGVAITGQEELGLTLIITEGFGKMRMSQVTFDILNNFDGFIASVNGETQIRAGVMRPEIIIPHDEVTEEDSGEELSSGIVPGTPVRIISQPYFGAIGEVASLPMELHQVDSESQVRVFDVKLSDHTIVTVPRANVEIIEE